MTDTTPAPEASPAPVRRNRAAWVLPLASLMVAGALVGQQYYRHAALERRISETERELFTLRARIPKGAAVKLHEHNRDESHEEHVPDRHP